MTQRYNFRKALDEIVESGLFGLDDDTKRKFDQKISKEEEEELLLSQVEPIIRVSGGVKTTPNTILNEMLFNAYKRSKVADSVYAPYDGRIIMCKKEIDRRLGFVIDSIRKYIEDRMVDRAEKETVNIHEFYVDTVGLDVDAYKKLVDYAVETSPKLELLGGFDKLTGEYQPRVAKAGFFGGS
jgi:hypothetical protein